MKNHAITNQKIWPVAILALLGACGKIGELQPESGSSAIVAAYGQEKADSPSELLEPSAQARPGRSVELLRRSQRREDDEFDLPPGSQPQVKSPTPATDPAPAAENPKE